MSPRLSSPLGLDDDQDDMTSAVQSSLRALASRWPKDQLRLQSPTLQFSNAITAATDRVFGPSAGSREEAAGRRMLESLTRIREGAASKQFPLPERIRHPASSPRHFDNLLDGIERAERGESLSWWKRTFRLSRQQ